MSADWLGARLHCSAWSVLGVLPGRMDQRAAAAYFHRHYRRDDPWAYGGPAEQRRLAMVEESLPPVPPMTVLEVGCGEGHLTQRLAQRWPGSEVRVIDVSERAVRRARERVGSAASFEVTDVRAWARSYAGPPVGLVVMTDVLYYLGSRAHVRRALRRVRPHLAPGGHVLVGHAAAPASWLHRWAAEGLGLPVCRESSTLSGAGYRVSVLGPVPGT